MKGKDGRHARKVGLIGLLTEDKTLYQQGAFGGATIEPVVEAAIRYRDCNLTAISLTVVYGLVT